MVVVAHLGGAGRTSQIGLGDLIAFAVTIRSGLIIRQQTFRNKDEALKAIGLRE